MTKQAPPQPPPRWLVREMATNWHRCAPLQSWGLVSGAPQFGSAAERAEQLAAMLKKRSNAFDRHVLRRLALDLMCASFPPGNPPPDALINLMRMALGLPEEHRVGGWAVGFLTADGRIKDRRGAPKLEAWMEAADVDKAYYRKHGKIMSQRTLQSELERRRGHPPSTSTLREWRNEPSYRERADLPDQEPRSSRDERKRKF